MRRHRRSPDKALIIEGRARTEAGTYEGANRERVRRMAILYLGEAVGKRYAESLAREPAVVARVTLLRLISWDYPKHD